MKRMFVMPVMPICFLVLVLLSGCASYPPKQVGPNEWKVIAQMGFVTTQNADLARQAQELCPYGYDEIGERVRGNDMFGVIIRCRPANSEIK